MFEGCGGYDEDERLTSKCKRPNPEGGSHFDLAAKAKGGFVEYLRSKVRAEDCERWVVLYEQIHSATKV